MLLTLWDLRVMLKIEWRSGFGYGDFVTGLGYAHNASIKYDTEVNINFHWNHDLDYLESKDDPETIIERMYYVYGTMVPKTNVHVTHTPNSHPKYRFINNVDESNPLHGLWHTNLKLTTNKSVVLWRSKFNTFFPGKAKDPIYNRWDYVVKWLTDQGYDVQEVTYRTPIKEVIEKIRTCEFGIGYDGMIHQLFKYMWKPLIVICERHQLNKLLIPQALLIKDEQSLYVNGIQSCVNQSNKKIAFYKNELNKWVHLKEDIKRHNLYNVEIY